MIVLSKHKHLNIKRFRPTLREVAALAGVSQATASLALRGRPAVDAATRARVLEAATQLRYVPNLNGRRLARGRAETIGVIQGRNMTTLFSDSFYRMVLAGAGEAAQAAGYSLMIAPTLRKDTSVMEMLEHVGPGTVDGVLVVGVLEQEAIFALRDLGLPVVVVDTYLPGTDIPAVAHDYRAGAWQLTRHLLQLGHRRIAFVGADVDYPFGRDTHDGYRDALSSAGLPYSSVLVRMVAISAEAAAAATRDLLSATPAPTALVTVTDTMAIGAMRAAHELGRRVPEDVAVVGMDDIELSAHTNPPLTTVRVPKEEMGRLAAERLIALSRGQQPTPSVLMLSGTLVVRRSCGAGSAGRPTGEVWS
jgi:DNA-binding LacI/PurR family transcriptional regulator